MGNLFKVEADGNLTFSIERKMLDNVRAVRTWYTNQKFSWIAVAGLSVIDIMGFLQVAQKTMSDNLFSRIIVIAAFAVAFEIAPLYIGYVLCLKSYDLWRQSEKFDLGKFILILATSSFILGVIANSIYRFMTMDVAYKSRIDNSIHAIALPMTIVMVILPIITSFVNIIIGCLSFDPLLFELLHLRKKLRVLKVRKRQLTSSLEELAKEEHLQTFVNENEDQYCNEERKRIQAIRQRLMNYITLKTALAYRDIDN